MVRDFNSDDEGKSVMTADGDMVGTVDRVDGATAFVRPDQNLPQSTRQRLGWTTEGEETYRLQKSNVSQISDDEIHLANDL